MKKTVEQLEDFIGSWNGEDSHFLYEGDIYLEDDVYEAEDELRKLKNKKTLEQLEWETKFIKNKGM